MKMSESERYFALMGLLVVLGLGYLADKEFSRAERMAAAGFVPMHLANDLTTYWLPIPKQEKKLGAF